MSRCLVKKKRKLLNTNLRYLKRLWYVQRQIYVYGKYNILLKFLHSICILARGITINIQ